MIANNADADGGEVVVRFAQHGWVFETWNREEASDWGPLPDNVGLVVPLGSDWSVYWADIAQNVAAEAALLHAAHTHGVPIFGICFGGQMLAHALGGTVERSPRPEIGWFSVNFSPKLAEFEQEVWFQWHYDRFVPPVGAEVLATGAQGAQAFVMGRSLGLQFHPEITSGIVERWSSGQGEAELQRAGIDRAGLVAATRSHAHVSAGAAHRLVDWFVANV
jgi:GMP synthase-like glutamine amidotransferase